MASEKTPPTCKAPSRRETHRSELASLVEACHWPASSVSDLWLKLPRDNPSHSHHPKEESATKWTPAICAPCHQKPATGLSLSSQGLAQTPADAMVPWAPAAGSTSKNPRIIAIQIPIKELLTPTDEVFVDRNSTTIPAGPRSHGHDWDDLKEPL